MLLLSMMMTNSFKLTMFIHALCVLFVVRSEARLSRSIPELNLSEWSKLDLEFGSKMSHIHHGVAQGEISTSDGIFEYTKSLTEFLESKPEFLEEKTE